MAIVPRIFRCIHTTFIHIDTTWNVQQQINLLKKLLSVPGILPFVSCEDHLSSLQMQIIAHALSDAGRHILTCTGS